MLNEVKLVILRVFYEFFFVKQLEQVKKVFVRGWETSI